jgi:hypothetical protein
MKRLMTLAAALSLLAFSATASAVQGTETRAVKPQPAAHPHLPAVAKTAEVHNHKGHIHGKGKADEPSKERPVAPGGGH